MKTIETYNDHEVRIRLLEKIAEKIDFRLDKIESKNDSHFMWTIGIIFTFMITNFALFATVILHSIKLI